MWVGLSQPPSTLPDGGGNSNIFGISPLFGEDGPILTHFSDGLVQPPTSLPVGILHVFRTLSNRLGLILTKKGGLGSTGVSQVGADR